MINEQVDLTNPLTVIHHDEEVLVVQTLAYSEDNNLSDAMLVENEPSFGAFNLGLHVNDEPKQVLRHRCQLLTEIDKHMYKFDAISHTQNIVDDNKSTYAKNCHTIHWLNQVHGNQVVDIDVLGTNTQINPPEADAQITTQQAQALAIMTADCVPIMIYCPDTGQVAGVHAGWHGLAKGVIAATIKKLKAHDADNVCIQAWIGACISGKNYEVSKEVLDKVVAGTVTNFVKQGEKNKIGTGVAILSAESLQEQICIPHQDQAKVWLDLPRLARIQLAQLGVFVMTEDVPCSYADTRYYSHRRATHKRQQSTGRMAMLIVKK